MILGYLGLAYIVFSVYIIWFAKRKPQKLYARFIYSFLVVIFTLLLTNFSFSPKTSFYLKSFPIHLDNEYVETIEAEQYRIVVYSTLNESDTNQVYEFYIFQEFLVGYIDSGLDSGFSFYNNDETNTSMVIRAIATEESLYFMLYNKDLVNYDSLVIGDQVVDLNVDLNSPFTLFEVIKTSDEPLVITLNGIELTNPYAEVFDE